MRAVPQRPASRSWVETTPISSARRTSSVRLWYCGTSPTSKASKSARMCVLTVSTLTYSASPISRFDAAPPPRSSAGRQSSTSTLRCESVGFGATRSSAGVVRRMSSSPPEWKTSCVRPTRTTSPSCSTCGRVMRDALTWVPFDDPRSSTVHAPPTSSSSACARDTSESHGSATSHAARRPIERRCCSGPSGTIRSASSPSRYSRNAVPVRCASITALRSEEHTSELQSHRDLHSFPTRRSPDREAVLLGAERHDPERIVAVPVLEERRARTLRLDHRLELGGRVAMQSEGFRHDATLSHTVRDTTIKERQQDAWNATAPLARLRRGE